MGIALREKYLDSLGQKLVDFFPEFVTPTLDPRKRDITIEHLITMRAGFDVNETSDYSNILNQNTNWMKGIINLPMRANPGQEFNYSSLNTHRVSGILAKASGMSAKSLAERFLLEPLGISVISWPADPRATPLREVHWWFIPETWHDSGTCISTTVGHAAYPLFPKTG